VKPRAYVLRIVDVGSSIDLAVAERALAGQRAPDLLRGAPGGGVGGVKLATQPFDVELGERLVAGRSVRVRVRLFDFGIASFRFALDLDGLAPPALVALGAEIEDDGGFDDSARAEWAALLPRLGGAVVKPQTIDFVEDYAVFVLPRDPDGGASPGDTVTRLLLGEDDPRPLAKEQHKDVRRRAIRYFADDLVVVDYDAAVVIDAACATDLVDLFELATAHLLELRYYDALLARASQAIADDAARAARTRWLVRSPFEGVAERAAKLLLDLTEMTDRFERSITLLGDVHSVKVYRATEKRLRIAELQRSVDEKLASLGRFAEVLGDQVHARRGLFLESTVVLLIVIEIGLALVHR
jgi:hypothetical protein